MVIASDAERPYLLSNLAFPPSGPSLGPETAGAPVAHSPSSSVASSPSSSSSSNSTVDASSPDSPISSPRIDHLNRPKHHHAASSSSGSPSSGAAARAAAAAAAPKSSAALFALAAAALDRTQSAISSISAEPRLRPRQSLSRLLNDVDGGVSSHGGEPGARTGTASSNFSSSSSTLASQPFGSGSSAQDLPSQPYSETDANQPVPYFVPRTRIDGKMHQTSSRLLRMTDDDRPFTKDFKDLFSTLIVSLLPLSAHRVRLTKVENTFLSEDAINNLGSLKFSQSNRMPDPKDPSRIVTTTTTTTFSMAKDMARSICQRFLDARFIESADGKLQQLYTMKGTVWQLTPKGVCILDRFCSRNGIQQKQVAELVSASVLHLVILERDNQNDKLVSDRGTIEVIFRRFIGISGPNIKATVSQADSDSLSDYRDGLIGVKMAAERKVGGKTYKDTFTGKAAADWLMDCSTTVDRREAVDLATFFVQYELIEAVQPDRSQIFSSNQHFQPSKHAIYQMTVRGKDVVNGGLGRGRTSESEVASSSKQVARDSNTQRLEKILNDPALRLLFRENLRETHCEENLSFYLDVDEFVRACRAATRAAQKAPNNTTSLDSVKEIMAQAYSIYNAFLAPGSPCELNIDHQLRNNLATRMTKAVGQDVAMVDTLHEVTSLFEDAKIAVFKLMASDSVPKFLRSPKYEQTLRNYDFDAIVVGSGGHPHTRMLERSQSRSNRK